MKPRGSSTVCYAETFRMNLKKTLALDMIQALNSTSPNRILKACACPHLRRADRRLSRLGRPLAANRYARPTSASHAAKKSIASSIRGVANTPSVPKQRQGTISRCDQTHMSRLIGPKRLPALFTNGTQSRTMSYARQIVPRFSLRGTSGYACRNLL